MMLLQRTIVLITCALFISSAQIRLEVGTGKQFSTIDSALQSITKPLTADVTVVVDIPQSGFSEIGTTVDLTALQANGYSVSIIASNGKFYNYYVDNDIEFRFRDGDEVTRIETSNGMQGTLLRKVIEKNNSVQKEYLLKNYQGSTITTIDENGNRVGAIYEYYPYGKEVMLNVTSSGTGQNILTQTFTGKEMDLFTGEYPSNQDGNGLYYFGARYYDSDIGKWLTTDSKKQYFDQYSYVGGNPISQVDPNGLWGEDFHYEMTHAIALQNGFDPKHAEVLAMYDNETDQGLTSFLPIVGNQSYHFNTNPGFKGGSGGDSRMIIARNKMDAAVYWANLAKEYSFMRSVFMTFSLLRLGQGLHALQDIYSHNDNVTRAQPILSDRVLTVYDHLNNMECDNIGENIEGAIGAAQATRNYISEYKERSSDKNEKK